jgi:hypothetical protein
VGGYPQSCWNQHSCLFCSRRAVNWTKRRGSFSTVLSVKKTRVSQFIFQTLYTKNKSLMVQRISMQCTLTF